MVRTTAGSPVTGGSGERGDKPVMAILADHLDVPSSTDCLTARMWPTWFFSSTLNTDLDAQRHSVREGECNAIQCGLPEGLPPERANGQKGAKTRGLPRRALLRTTRLRRRHKASVNAF